MVESTEQTQKDEVKHDVEYEDENVANAVSLKPKLIFTNKANEK